MKIYFLDLKMQKDEKDDCQIEQNGEVFSEWMYPPHLEELPEGSLIESHHKAYVRHESEFATYRDFERTC